MTPTPTAAEVAATLAAMEAPCVSEAMQSLAQMASNASVSMHIWDRHSNAVLQLCAALRASQEREAAAVAVIECERVENKALAIMRFAENEIWRAEERGDDASIKKAYDRHSEACEAADKAHMLAKAARIAFEAARKDTAP